MTILKPFKAIRPTKEFAPKIAALPYDVINSKEAKEMVKNNPYSFLYVDKAEIDLDSNIDIYDLKVYEKAKENLQAMIDDKVLIKDTKENIYIYKQTMDDKEQIGLVGCVSVDDYMNNNIKKHENTIEEKQKDRRNHIDYCNGNTGPIFLTYEAKEDINKTIEIWMDRNNPVYNFVSEDDIRHEVWVIDDNDIIDKLINLFKNINSLYIADGHHRAASAVDVAKMRRSKNIDFTGEEEFNYFLGVLFPYDQLHVMDYNRVVEDLKGLSINDFLEKVKENFIVEEIKNEKPYRPNKKHSFGMYLEDRWYKLETKEGSFDKRDLVKSLDASILQDNILEGILGIDDPRTNKRIDFVGGIRGLKELEDRVNEGMAIAFSLFPTAIDDLMKVSDQGSTMPPKSTWFEPKLRSGLFIHDLE